MKETQIHEKIIQLLGEAKTIAHELKKCSEILLLKAQEQKLKEAA